MTALLDLGRQLGCSEAWVLTEAGNEAARALYRSAGGLEATGLVMTTFPLTPDHGAPREREDLVPPV
jgi:aminoglycoside 6'-N-acetyltransferase I